MRHDQLTHELLGRIRDRTEITSLSGCWMWKGNRNNGYGVVGTRIDGESKVVYVHRVVWSWENGADIGEGMQIDHTCANPLCVNPVHLECVTQAENLARARARRKIMKRS